MANLFISLSLVTFARIDAAAMDILLLSPPVIGMKPVLLIEESLLLSIFIKSEIAIPGFILSLDTAISKALTFSSVIFSLSISAGLILAIDQHLQDLIIFCSRRLLGIRFHSSAALQIGYQVYFLHDISNRDRYSN